MIDNFSLALTHGLLMLIAWRLMSRADLDREDAPPQDAAPPPRFAARRKPGDTPGA